MPDVYKVSCRSCDYAVRGVEWGTAVVMDDGSETVYQDPFEQSAVEKATGKSWEELVESQRIALRHAMVCLACGHWDYYITPTSYLDAQGNWFLPGYPEPALFLCKACGRKRLHPLPDEPGPLRRLLQALGLFRERVLCPKCRKGLLRFERLRTRRRERRAKKEWEIPAVLSVLGVLGFVAGVISTFAVSSLGQSPSLFTAVVGGICGGAAAVNLHESIFEEIGWARPALFVPIGIWMQSFIPSEDDPFWLAFEWFLVILLLALPVGGYSGGLVSILWKALAPRRFRDHLKPQEPLPAKGMAENEEKTPEVVCFLGFVAGAISSYAVLSYAVASEWPAPAFPRVAAYIGGLAGIFTVEEQESIFRALVWLLAYAGFAWIVFALLRVLPFVDYFIFFIEITVTYTVSIVVGRFAGALVFNLWKALGR